MAGRERFDGDTHESTILRLANDKALWQLDWRPRWSIDEVLHQTARWYRAYFDKSRSMQELTLEQIAEYESAASQPSGSSALHSIEMAAPVASPAVL